MKQTLSILLYSAAVLLGVPSQANERQYLPEDWPAVERCQQARRDLENRERLFPELSCEALVASARPGKQLLREPGSQRGHSDE